jgi:thiol-disulfide isomerase/thioredoxin
MKILLYALLLFSTVWVTAQNTRFSEEARNERLLDLNQQEISFGDILDQYAGQKILIDFWANWCRDCIVGMPGLKKLQQEHPDITFLFLSLDRSVESWLHGIQKYELEGEHYYIASGWKNCTLCTFVNLDWIPRYMVVDTDGSIVFFKAITTDDSELLKNL